MRRPRRVPSPGPDLHVDASDIVEEDGEALEERMTTKVGGLKMEKPLEIDIIIDPLIDVDRRTSSRAVSGLPSRNRAGLAGGHGGVVYA